VPVIFMTAHDDASTARKALSGGAAAYLIKPFSEEALLDAVRAALAPHDREAKGHAWSGCVVDDDASVRDAVGGLLRSAGRP